MAALLLALLLILSANPKLKLRPNVFLCLVGLLVFDGILTASIQLNHGEPTTGPSGYRVFIRLWLLTPWWDRSDLMLFRWHLRVLYIRLSQWAVGISMSPGKAFASGGRLSGVHLANGCYSAAQYAAVAAGLTILLWLGHRLTGRAAIVGVTFSILILLLTHTRTALLGLVVGIVVAGMSLFVVNARVRRFFGWTRAHRVDGCCYSGRLHNDMAGPGREFRRLDLPSPVGPTSGR